MPIKFYTDRTPCCEMCGAKRDTLLIGESSHGTVFRFVSYPDRGLTTPEKWFSFLRGKRIVCEAGYESDLAWIRGYDVVECVELQTA